MNQICLIGNLCRDNDVRVTPSGVKVVMNTIAVKRDFKNNEGEYDSDFINFVAYRNQAEFLEKYTAKGDKVAINGRWQHRSYTAKDGSTKYIDECVVNSIESLAPKKEESKEVKKEEPVKVSTDPFDDMDLPF